MYKFGKRSTQRAQGVYKYLFECATRCLEKSKYDMSIPWMGGVRLAEEQKEIFKNGYSKCDGYETLSYHQIEASETGYGMALDVIPYIAGKTTKELYEEHSRQNYFSRLMLIEWQEMILEYSEEGIDIGVMVWGGTFGATGWDKWHFEIRF